MEGTTERGGVMPVRLLTSAPVSSWANSPLRAWHVSPAQMFGSSAIEKPRAGFLVLHANVGQHSHCLPALNSPFFFTTAPNIRKEVSSHRKEGEENKPLSASW